jgi:hypothetical protein
LLTDKKLRRGTHRSIRALEKEIRDWIAAWNETPNPKYAGVGDRKVLHCRECSFVSSIFVIRAGTFPAMPSLCRDVSAVSVGRTARTGDELHVPRPGEGESPVLILEASVVVPTLQPRLQVMYGDRGKREERR